MTQCKGVGLFLERSPRDEWLLWSTPRDGGYVSHLPFLRLQHNFECLVSAILDTVDLFNA